MSTSKRLFITLMATLLTCVLLTSCMFRDLKKDIAEEKISFRLFGRIENMAQAEKHVWVLLYAQRDGKLLIDRFILPGDDGTYAFLITPGTYMVAGFEDTNNNGRHDPGEPAGAWGSPDKIVVAGEYETESEKKVLADHDFELISGSFPLDNVVASVENSADLASSLVKIGHPASWSDPAFDQENADTGFWKPITFLKQHGNGIYFIEPYDSDKIPILFVHGAAGTPRAWKALAESIDRQHYQPWVYYYPSGMRLNLISTALEKIIVRLQTDYGFEQMGVVAHSMGGLVSRSFILKHMAAGSKGTVKVFVSFSTPWGGVATAAEGAEHAPEAIPSWLDVEPKSEFIKKIYADSLRPIVPHYLFFGYRGDCSLFMANNDGTVEILSQLDMRAQDDAVLVRGQNEDHMSILESKRSAEYLNMAIESAF
jgi:uncharacterized alpha/beta hydrolase family protein